MSTAEELRKKLLDLANKPLKEQQEQPTSLPEEPPPIPKELPPLPKESISKQNNPFIVNPDIMDEKDTENLIDVMTNKRVKPVEYSSKNQSHKRGIDALNKIINYQNKTIDEVAKARKSGDSSLLKTPEYYYQDEDLVNNIFKVGNEIQNSNIVRPKSQFLQFKNQNLKPEIQQEIKNSIMNSDYEKAIDLAHNKNNMFAGRGVFNRTIEDILQNEMNIKPDEHDKLYDLFKDSDLLRNVKIIKKPLPEESVGGYYNPTATEEHPFGHIVLNTNNKNPSKLSIILHELKHARDRLYNMDLRDKMHSSNFPLEIPQDQVSLSKLNPKTGEKIEYSLPGYAHLDKEASGGLIAHHIEPYAEINTIKGLQKNKLFGLLPLAAALGATAYSTSSKADEGDYEGVAKDIAENTADVGSLGFYSAAKKLGAGKSGKNILKDIAVSDRAGEPFDWSDYSKEDIDQLHEGLKDTAHAAAYLTPAAPYVGAADTGMMLGQGTGVIENLYKNYKNNQSVLDPEFEKQEEESKRAQEEWEARHKRVNETTGIERANKIKRSIEAKK
jgi:hypothetical protein